MANVEATQAQKHFSEILSRVDQQKERIVIEAEGQAIAAVISYADLKRLEALEDTKDLLDFQQAVAENNGETYSVEEVIAYYNTTHGTTFTVENLLDG